MAGLESRLTQEIDEINGFLQSQLNFFYGWIEATLSRFSLPAISLKLEDLSQVVPSELHDLCENLREVLEFSAQLETFASLNRDAVQRLLAKYGQSSVHPCVDDCELRGLLYASPWMNTACRLRDLMSLATRAQALHQGTHSTQSLLLQRVSPIALGCTSDEVHRCLRSDDPASLMVVLASPVSYMDNQAMLYSVLQVAIIHQATMCVKSLLEEITAPLDEQECTHRDVLHQLIINTVRCRSSHDSLDVLTETFRELSPYQHHLMVVKDWRQRYALHYAAEHGLVELCRQLLKFMSPMAITERDAAGLTPLHLAIHGNHMTVVKNLLSADGAFALLSAAVIGDLLQLAVQRGLVEVCKYLVTIGRGLNFVDKRSCTPLYNAADHGHVGLVETLLTVSPALDINRVEGAYGWSALTVASVRGHLQIVKLLLQSGADVKSKDCRGWSAIEHASYRAHMAVVTAIEEASVSVDAFDVPSDAQVCSSATRPTDLLRPTYFSSDEPTPQSILPVASIFVNLGTLDITSSNSILDFEPTFTDYLTTRSSGHMFLEISGTPCREEPYVVRLPLLGDVSERTWLFSTPEPGKLRLKFNIWEYMGNAKTSKKLLATGVVLLGSIRGWFRPERQSLKRDSLVALSTPEGEYAGTVAFTHLVCQSYKAPTTVKAIQKMRSMTSTQVIGHRGLGWNMSGLGRMQIGEHTIQSLQSALDQGADLIEFDVQTTRDRVPVIYHDWTCSETGLDVPIHAMTFNQVSPTSHPEKLHGSLQPTVYSGWP